MNWMFYEVSSELQFRSSVEVLLLLVMQKMLSGVLS